MWRPAVGRKCRKAKRINMINGRTSLIAHLGYPTETFTAPMIYNPWFEQRGIDVDDRSCCVPHVATNERCDDAPHVVGLAPSPFGDEPLGVPLELRGEAHRSILTATPPSCR